MVFHLRIYLFSDSGFAGCNERLSLAAFPEFFPECL